MQEKSYHSEKSASFGIPAGCYHIFKLKFTCPHTAVPSDTQVLLVLNVEVIRMRHLQCNRRLRGRWRRKQEVGRKGKKIAVEVEWRLETGKQIRQSALELSRRKWKYVFV